MNKEETLAKVGEKIKGMRTAMLVTITESGALHARPMSTQEVDFNGEFWFMTSKGSEKIKHIQANPNVGLLYGDGVRFVSMEGMAEVTEDRDKIKELWSDFYKAWFKDENDRNITLIKVTIQAGEYWDYPGGKVGAFIDMATSAVTGNQSEGGENESFIL